MPIENNNALDFKAFFLLYKDKVYKYAYLHLKEESAAADLVQEAFSRIWKKWTELDENKNPQSYLYTIARNLVFDELRKQKIRFQFQAADIDQTKFRIKVVKPILFIKSVIVSLFILLCLRRLSIV